MVSQSGDGKIRLYTKIRMNTGDLSLYPQQDLRSREEMNPTGKTKVSAALDPDLAVIVGQLRSKMRLDLESG